MSRNIDHGSISIDKTAREKLSERIRAEIDAACQYCSDAPPPYEYSPVFLPRAFTSRYDEMSVTKLLGKYKPSSTALIHYDKDGTMTGSGQVDLLYSMHETAAQETSEFIWNVLPMKFLPPTLGYLDNEYVQLFLMDLPKHEDPETMKEYLENDFKAKNVQVFYDATGTFIGTLATHMPTKMVVKFRKSLIYSLDGKTYPFLALQIE